MHRIDIFDQLFVPIFLLQHKAKIWAQFLLLTFLFMGIANRHTTAYGLWTIRR